MRKTRIAEHRTIVAVLAIGLLALLPQPATTAATQVQSPFERAHALPGNVLIVILDDVSTRDVSTYDLGFGSTAQTPTLDSLAAIGVTFTRAWSNPMCSPSRAAILTGRYGFRNGVGWVIHNNATQANLGLDPSETLIPEALSPSVATALFGKWHLGVQADGPAHPVDQGFDLFEGMNFNGGYGDGYGGQASWLKTVANSGGVATQLQETEYSTTAITDDAIQWIRDQDGPWFAVVAHQAPHSWNNGGPVFHVAPANLRYTPVPPSPTDREMYLSMLEAADNEIGRLLSHLDLGATTVIVVGDNGTPKHVAPDGEKAKGSPYQRGVHVPLIVAGARVTRVGTEDSQVHLADLFSTTLQLMGADPPAGVELDSLSLVPYLRSAGLPSQRSHTLAEAYTPNNQPLPINPLKAIRGFRDDEYTLMRIHGATDLLFRLPIDPDQQTDLARDPAYKAKLLELQEELDDLVGN